MPNLQKRYPQIAVAHGEGFHTLIRELFEEKILADYRIVEDYKRDAKRSQDAFLKRYAHPFLVIVDRPTAEDDDEKSGSFFFTKAYMSLEDKNATLGGGPVLDPKAVVLPVKKSAAKTAKLSSLATTVMVGRNDDNDVVITSAGVSKYHFYIATLPFSDDEYTISDNGSTNGTFVNMQKVQPSSRFPLKSGDKITLGNAIGLRFYLAADFWENLQ